MYWWSVYSPVLASFCLEFAIKTEYSQAWEPSSALCFTIGQPRNLKKQTSTKNKKKCQSSLFQITYLSYSYCIHYNQQSFSKSLITGVSDKWAWSYRKWRLWTEQLIHQKKIYRVCGLKCRNSFQILRKGCFEHSS